MDYCKINGVSYDVIVTDIQEDFTILFSENTGRTLDDGAPMELDPLGTFFSHKVTFKRSQDNVEEFDKLYDFLTTPRYEGFPIEIVHDQTTLKYEAYVSQGSRKIIRILRKLQKVFWGELVVNFVPIKAQILPEGEGETPEQETLPTQEKTVQITENGTTEILPDEGYVLSKVVANVNVPIPDGYIQPSGTLSITENGTYDVTDKASVTVAVEAEDSPLPIEIATETEMTALLESGEVGGVYKYTGETTDTYENGALYVLEATLITFTINGTTYEAEEGMTWGEWVESDYNTGGFGIDSTGVYKNTGSGNMYVYDDDPVYIYTNGAKIMTSSDIIVAEYVYYYRTTSSGGSN